MSLARDQLPSADERRAPEAAPARPRLDGPLTPPLLLALQRSGGNQATRALIQRLLDRTDLGPDVVEFEDADTLPTQLGNLDSDKTNKYVKQARYGERVYKKVPKGGGFQIKKVDPLVKAQQENAKLKEKLAVAEKTLFGVNDNGGTEGTFEYVANYLYGEVFDTDSAAAQQIWDEVWSVGESVTGIPQRVRNDIPDQSALLQRLIDIGLDASWQKVPVTELVTITSGGQKPAASMRIAVRRITDYFSALFHRAPWPKTAGVGFHTTDGAPSSVAKSKDEGGWGGVTRPITVDFFKTRYALAKSWNPLGGWLERHGETFRKGIKDNELLSTVSVATAIHGSVRFPLANINRAGRKRVKKKGVRTFRMEAYTYAVVVREGYATFAKQGANAMGEIAVGDIPVEDIIGWSKVTRWHKYDDQAETVPSTVDFWYRMSHLERNPEFPRGGIYDRMFASASAEIDGERKLTAELYKA